MFVVCGPLRKEQHLQQNKLSFFYFQEQSGHQISSFKLSGEETYTREYCLDLLPNSHN